jgi:hypothetical protein
VQFDLFLPQRPPMASTVCPAVVALSNRARSNMLSIVEHTIAMAGGSGRDVEHSIPPTPAARQHCWVTGPDGMPHPGLVVGWERRATGWVAQVAYLVEGESALVVQWVASQLLQPVGNAM